MGIRNQARRYDRSKEPTGDCHVFLVMPAHYTVRKAKRVPIPKKSSDREFVPEILRVRRSGSASISADSSHFLISAPESGACCLFDGEAVMAGINYGRGGLGGVRGRRAVTHICV